MYDWLSHFRQFCMCGRGREGGDRRGRRGSRGTGRGTFYTLLLSRLKEKKTINISKDMYVHVHPCILYNVQDIKIELLYVVIGSDKAETII